MAHHVLTMAQARILYKKMLHESEWEGSSMQQAYEQKLLSYPNVQRTSDQKIEIRSKGRSYLLWEDFRPEGKRAPWMSSVQGAV